MKRLKIFLCGVLVLSIGVGLVLAQDPAGTEAVNQELKDSDVQWVLGEVVNVDLGNNVINVRYLDPEDNQMKDISLNVDSGTTYEGIKSLEEIKAMDSLSIDYIITQDGKNLARNIGLDKPEESRVTGDVQAEKNTEAVGPLEAEKQTLEIVQ